MIETILRCDRCNSVWREEMDDHWVSLEVSAGEGPRLRAGRIDLCGECEADMLRFMAGEVFHKFLKRDP